MPPRCLAGRSGSVYMTEARITAACDGDDGGFGGQLQTVMAKLVLTRKSELLMPMLPEKGTKTKVSMRCAWKP